MANLRERLTDEEWKAHRRAISAKFRATHLEQERERNKKVQAIWRANNPEWSKQRSAKWRAANPERAKESYTKWRATNPDKAKLIDLKGSLKKRYGITLEEYDAMLSAQNGRCVICGTDKPGGRGRWHVDHCSETKAVRRLLCSSCNPGLGFFKHDINLLQRAIGYLREFAAPCR
jgi:hypothetical protein